MNKPIAFIFAFLLILGCSRSEKYADILNRAYKLTDSNPDSVAKLLDLIDAPEKLPPSAKADYGYFKSLAHLKTGKAMAEDSLILFTLDYYKKNNNTGRLSRAYQLATAHFLWKNDITSAKETAQEGLQYNFGVNDSAQIAQSYEILAEVSGIKKDYKNGIGYSLAASRYDTKENYGRDYNIGLAYAFNEQADSAAFFIKKSIASALVQGDTVAASHFIRNQADYLYEQHKYAESLSLMKQLRDINPSLGSTSYLTFVSLYLALHQLDSAQVYLNIANKLKSSEKNNYLISIDNHIMAMQYVIDYAQGKHLSWTNVGRYNDSVWVDSQNKIARIAEEKDIRNQLEQKNLKLTVDRQRIFLALISVVLIGAILAFVFLYYNNKKKEKIETLQSMLKEAMHSNDATKDDAFFKKMLLQQLGLVRQVATAPTAQNQSLLKQISGIANKDIPVEDLLNWNDLYRTIDSIYDNFHIRLLQNYGTVLNDREIQLCCLLCAEFSTKEISVVTQQSVRTIYQRKTTIRQKLGMDEKDDIVEFLNNTVIK